MLTYGYWRRKFGADRSIIGRNITIDGKPRQIIGVCRKDSVFSIGMISPLILPFNSTGIRLFLGKFSYEGLARLKPGATVEQANADVARMLPIVVRSFPPPPGFSLELLKKANIGPNVRPLMKDVVGDVGGISGS